MADHAILLVARGTILREPERALEPVDRRGRVLVPDERCDPLGHFRSRESRIAAARRRGGSPTLRSSGRRYAPRARSEEHTSELQSQSNLVCRLLLEKKKK